MEKITEKEAEDMIKQEKEKINQILEAGGKVIKTIIEEKNTITTITKIEPVEGESTSSTVIQAKNGIIID